MTKKWLRERKFEYYHLLAREEGYRSRSAYKLLQAVEKYHFLNKGDVVVDLGAAPGGWMQVVRKIVGDDGYVLGIDFKPIDNLGFDNVSSIVSDVEKLEGPDIVRRLPKEADVVLSDLSPNISGVWSLDHFKQIFLSETSLNHAVAVLRDGGSFFVKVFHGGSLNKFIDRVRTHFKVVRVMKPKASRKRSSEVYVVALNFKGN